MQTDHLAVIDLETTGTNPDIHDVLSVAIVPLDDSDSPLHIHIKCQSGKWSSFARKNFDKFRNEWQQQAVAPTQACKRIEDYLANTFGSSEVTLIGHNIGFDTAFLSHLASLGNREHIAGVSHRTVDTHTMLFILYQLGRIPSSALSSDGAFNHFEISVPGNARHTALGDAIATRELYIHLMRSFADFKGVTADSDVALFRKA